MQLCKQKLEMIENNHLYHIQKAIERLNKITWMEGLMVSTQLMYVVRDVLF